MYYFVANNSNLCILSLIGWPFQIPRVALLLSEDAKDFAREVEEDPRRANEFIQKFGDHVSVAQSLGKRQGIAIEG